VATKTHVQAATAIARIHFDLDMTRPYRIVRRLIDCTGGLHVLLADP
jgi:hypothetical protein